MTEKEFTVVEDSIVFKQQYLQHINNIEETITILMDDCRNEQYIFKEVDFVNNEILLDDDIFQKLPTDINTKELYEIKVFSQKLMNESINGISLHSFKISHKENEIKVMLLIWNNSNNKFDMKFVPITISDKNGNIIIQGIYSCDINLNPSKIGVYTIKISCPNDIDKYDLNNCKISFKA